MIDERTFKNVLAVIRANQEKGHTVLFDGFRVGLVKEADEGFTLVDQYKMGVSGVDYAREDFDTISVLVFADRFQVIKKEPLFPG